MKFFLVPLLVLFTQLIQGVPAFSQSGSPFEPTELPPGVLPLPEPGSGSVAGTLISVDNATFYKEVIPPEIYRLIRFNGAVIDAARRIKYELRFDEDWEQGSRDLGKIDKKLGSDGSIEFPPLKVRGFIFGDGSAIDSEWSLNKTKEDDSSKQVVATESGASKQQITTPDALVYKILWNINSAIWSQGLLEYHFRMLWLKDGKSIRNVRATFQRVYPWLLDPNFKLPQLFRERFTFYYPEPLHGLSWLTIRFQNKDEDLVWAYSSAIAKVRQLTASNRADSLITSSFAAEDFFGWTGHPANYRAKILDKVVALVPFPGAEMGILDSNLRPCYRLTNTGGQADQAIWNFETPKFPEAADWLPIRAVFVPRSVYKLELTTNDPYSLYGREVLYVDSETMMPVYKIVYDRAGRHWKTVITSFGMAATQDRRRRTIYPGFTIVLDMISGKEFVLDYSKIRYCDSYPQDIQLSQFDPKRLVP